MVLNHWSCSSPMILFSASTPVNVRFVPDNCNVFFFFILLYFSKSSALPVVFWAVHVFLSLREWRGFLIKSRLGGGSEGCSADPHSSSALIGFVTVRPKSGQHCSSAAGFWGACARCGPLAVTVYLDFTAAVVWCGDLFRLFCHKHKSVAQL